MKNSQALKWNWLWDGSTPPFPFYSCTNTYNNYLGFGNVVFTIIIHLHTVAITNYYSDNVYVQCKLNLPPALWWAQGSPLLPLLLQTVHPPTDPEDRHWQFKPFSCPECRQGTTLPQGEAFCCDSAPSSSVQNVSSNTKWWEYFLGTIQSPSTNLNLKGEELNRTDSEAGASTLQMRTKHEEPMKIYIFTCCCLICQDCTIDKDHSGHNHIFIKSAASERRKKSLFSIWILWRKWRWICPMLWRRCSPPNVR